MAQKPHNLYQSKQVSEMDRFAIEHFEIPANVLMERAGEAAFKKLKLKKGLLKIAVDRTQLEKNHLLES